MGSWRVRHNWATSLSLFIFMHWRRKWQLIPVFLPGESQEWGSLVGCRLWGHTELDTAEWLSSSSSSKYCGSGLWMALNPKVQSVGLWECLWFWILLYLKITLEKPVSLTESLGWWRSKRQRSGRCSKLGTLRTRERCVRLAMKVRPHSP